MLTDGKFLIKPFQNLTQAIQQELRLSNEEYSQLEKNCIWTQILNEVEDSKNLKISNNANITPNKENNYFINTGSIIEFSEESWNRIINWIKAIFPEKYTEAKNNENLTNLPTIPDLSPEEVKDLVGHNNTKYANQKGVKIGSMWYDFDDKGRCQFIYNQKPQINSNAMSKPNIMITYEPNSDEILNIYQYMNQKEQNIDNSKICVKYDKTGSFSEYQIERRTPEEWIYNFYSNTGKLTSITHYTNTGELIESNNFNDNGEIFAKTIYNNGKIFNYNPNNPLESTLKDIFTNIDSITKESLYKTLDEIDKMNLTKYQNCSDSLYILMHQYSFNAGRHILEDIADCNPELLEFFETEAFNRANYQYGYKYIDDIEKDIKDHPNDYKKLSVDYQRLIARPLIYPIVNEQPEEDTYIFNKILDRPTRQEETGNCYLLTGIKGFDSKPLGRMFLANNRNDLEDGILITCNGNGKKYLITYEEILASDHLSSGDPDMRVWELAMDKYRRDCAYENPYLNIDVAGGTLGDVAVAFFGKNSEKISDLENFDLMSFNDENKVFSFSLCSFGANTNYPIATNENGENNIELIENHAYRITRVADGNVYFTNPWMDSIELSLSINKFKNLNSIVIESLNLM